MLPPVPKALLPEAFAGWVSADAPKKVTDPALADRANAAALKEYDFTDGVLATYKRSGETLSLRALRFHDASGAYGAYSFYRQNGWPKEQIGSGRHLEPQPGALLAGQYRRGCQFLPYRPHVRLGTARAGGRAARSRTGTKALAPPILANLPKASIWTGKPPTMPLAPAGYAGAGGVLPPELVGFDRGAEAVTANYSLRSNQATLTIIDYPTPQMAAAQETRIRAYIKAGSQAQPAWPKPLVDSDQASLEVRRSGPLVALVSGDAIPDESHKLLAMVHYESDLMSIPQPTESEVAKTGKLLLGHCRPGDHRLPARRSCWDFSWAAAGRSTASRAASRPLRSTKRSSSVSICGIER